MTRLSEHDVSVSVINGAGLALATGCDFVSVTLSEARYPYGDVQVITAMPATAEQLELSNPRRGDVRLLIDMRESVGDPVRTSEITGEHGGAMTSLTAMFTGDVAPVTARYFEAWNDDGVPGSAMRGNFLVKSRRLDHTAGTVTYQCATDEALATAYKLFGKATETSGSLSVRATVNYALGKIGAALTPGPVDAVIVEADAIIWEPGTSAWDYIRNIAEASGLVVRCDERRRWTLTRRDDIRPENVVLNRNVEAVERIELDADTYADGVVIRYVWQDPTTGTTKVRYDTASTTQAPVKVLLLERRMPFPGAGAAKYWLKRLSARGRVHELTQVSDYSMRPGMQFSAPLPLVPVQLGHIESVDWSLPERHMRITTTGAADAVAGAIDLFPAGVFIDTLTGVINDLNPGSETV